MHIEELLIKLAADPTTVVELYPALVKQSYWVLLGPKKNRTPENPTFLTYPSTGNLRELPAFTSDTFPLFDQLKRQTGAGAALMDGLPLFETLKSVIETLRSLVYLVGKEL
ncbi:MAG: hypothetical protein WBX25_02195 [Rhodomicrobium sp.]